MKPRFLLTLLCIPAATAVLYALYTHQIWEDYLITFRHTENLVNGNGLVYQPGERVHGFTSVLNTLVPALPMSLTHSFGFSLNFYRACSLATLLAGLYYLWKTLHEKLAAGVVELAVGAVLVATSVKIIAFTMNGQETGFLIGFLALALGAALRVGEPRNWRTMGLAWAGLMYTRPDSPIYIVMLAGIGYWVNPVRPKEYVQTLLRAGALCAVCYAPWFLFAWMYYGSPVPHTITAKAGDSVLVNDNLLATALVIWNAFPEIAGDALAPIYGLGTWPESVGWAAILSGGIASFVWIFPSVDRLARGLSFSSMLLFIYFSWLRTQRDAYPWYFGPAALFVGLIWMRLAFSAASSRPGAAGQIRRWVVRAALGGITVSAIYCFAYSLKQQEIHQVAVEENTRKEIGLWLKDNVAKGDGVYLEPIGYIGYYSGAKILDYPGLVSPEVVAARHKTHASFAELPAVLKPKWIVARRPELDQMRGIPDIVNAYVVVQQFNHLDAFDKQYGEFPGSRTLRFDLWYYILKRKDGM